MPVSFKPSETRSQVAALTSTTASAAADPAYKKHGLDHFAVVPRGGGRVGVNMKFAGSNFSVIGSEYDAAKNTLNITLKALGGGATGSSSTHDVGQVPPDATVVVDVRAWMGGSGLESQGTFAVPFGEPSVAGETGPERFGFQQFSVRRAADGSVDLNMRNPSTEFSVVGSEYDPNNNALKITLNQLGTGGAWSGTATTLDAGQVPPDAKVEVDVRSYDGNGLKLVGNFTVPLASAPAASTPVAPVGIDPNAARAVGHEWASTPVGATPPPAGAMSVFASRMCALTPLERQRAVLKEILGRNGMGAHDPNPRPDQIELGAVENGQQAYSLTLGSFRWEGHVDINSGKVDYNDPINERPSY